MSVEPPPYSLQDLEALYETHGTKTAVAKVLGVPRSTLRDWWSRLQLEEAKSSQFPHIESHQPKEWGDINKLIQKRGLSPDDWFVSKSAVAEWGTADNLNSYLRIDLAPKKVLPYPASLPSGWKAPKPRKGVVAKKGLVMLVSDHHEPFSDPELHKAVVSWIADHKPERIIILGDLLDYDSISRHPANPEFASSLQTTLNRAFETLCDYKAAATPDCQIELLDGNHEDRLRAIILKNIPQVHGLARANEEIPVLSTQNLLRLDELGIQYTRSEFGSYDSAQIKLAPTLAARHGWIAKKGSGASALATVENLGFSCIIGHTHKQSLVYDTNATIDGKPIHLLGCEIGTLANIRGGLGYVPGGNANWQQGFGTAQIGDDGIYSVELATYRGGVLIWRDWRYDTK